jgi:hypothetical protein
MEWTNGDKYTGDIHNQNPHGYGKKEFKNKASYEGQWKHALFDGIGTYIWPNGQRYVGKLLVI